MARVYPLWLFVAVAALIALAAFGFAQVVPGAGIWFVAGGSFLWLSHLWRRKSNG